MQTKEALDNFKILPINISACSAIEYAKCIATDEWDLSNEYTEYNDELPVLKLWYVWSRPWLPLLPE